MSHISEKKESKNSKKTTHKSFASKTPLMHSKIIKIPTAETDR